MQQMVEQYGPAIYSLCRRLTRSRFDADDLYQQTFLIAMGKQLRADGNPRALLTKICIDQWKNDVRKQSRRGRIAPISDEDPESACGAEDPVVQVEKDQQHAALRAIVAGLDDRCRLPVLLYYGMELPLAQIAGILRCPEGTVKSRLAAARTKIRKEMEAQGYDG